MNSVNDTLRENPYPGRLLLLGRTLDGSLNAAYVLTGRSAASKDRHFELISDQELAVSPIGRQGHDSLRHYTAACTAGAWTIYGNGEQVTEVAARLRDGQVPMVALHDLRYEPDPPICTPRITAVVERGTGRAWFGAARHPESERESPDTVVTALGDLLAGQAVLLSTYHSDGTQVATARRHLDLSLTAEDASQLLEELWKAMDHRFLVAATVFAPQQGVQGIVRHI